jgi:hypothetical protein
MQTRKLNVLKKAMALFVALAMVLPLFAPFSVRADESEDMLKLIELVQAWFPDCEIDGDCAAGCNFADIAEEDRFVRKVDFIMLASDEAGLLFLLLVQMYDESGGFDAWGVDLEGFLWLISLCEDGCGEINGECACEEDIDTDCGCEDSENAAAKWIHVCDELRPSIDLRPAPYTLVGSQKVRNITDHDILTINFISPMRVAPTMQNAIWGIDGVMEIINAVWLDANGVPIPVASLPLATSTTVVFNIVWPEDPAWSNLEALHPTRLSAMNPDADYEYVNISITTAVAVDPELNPVTVLYTTVEGTVQSLIPIRFGVSALPLYVVWVETSIGAMTLPGGTTGTARDTRVMSIAERSAQAVIPGIEWFEIEDGSFVPIRTDARLATPRQNAPNGSNRVYVRFSRPVRPEVGTIAISEFLYGAGGAGEGRGELEFTGPFRRNPGINGVWTQANAAAMDCLCWSLHTEQPNGPIAGQIEFGGYGCTWYIILDSTNVIRSTNTHFGTYAVDIFGQVATSLHGDDIWLYNADNNFRHIFSSAPTTPIEPQQLIVDQIWVSTTPDFLGDFVDGRANLVYSSNDVERVLLVDEILELLNELDPNDPLAYMVANNYMTVIFNRPVVPGSGSIDLNWQNLIHATNPRWFPVNFADWAAIAQPRYSTMPNWGPGWYEFNEEGNGYTVSGNFLDVQERHDDLPLPGLWDEFASELLANFHWNLGGGINIGQLSAHPWFGFNAMQVDLDLFRYNNRNLNQTNPILTPWAVQNVPFHTQATPGNPANIDRDATALITQGVETLPVLGQAGPRNVILPPRLRYTHRPYGLNDLELTERPADMVLNPSIRGLGNSWQPAFLLPAGGEAPGSRRITAEEVAIARSWDARTQPVNAINGEFIRVAVTGHVCAVYWLASHEDYTREDQDGFHTEDVEDPMQRILITQTMYFGVEDDPVPYVIGWGFFDGVRSDFYFPFTTTIDPARVQAAIDNNEFSFITTADPMGIPPAGLEAFLLAQGIAIEAGNLPGSLIIWFSEVVSPAGASPAQGIWGGAGTIGAEHSLDLGPATPAAGWSHRWYLTDDGDLFTGDVRFPVSFVVLDVERAMEDPAGNNTLVTINVIHYPELLMFGVDDLDPWHGDIGEHPAPAIRQGRAMQHAMLRFVLTPEVDKSALNAEILIAQSRLDFVDNTDNHSRIFANAAAAPFGEPFWTLPERSALHGAIATATAVRNNLAATQTMVNNATSALLSAVGTFNTQQKEGRGVYPVHPGKSKNLDDFAAALLVYEITVTVADGGYVYSESNNLKIAADGVTLEFVSVNSWLLKVTGGDGYIEFSSYDGEGDVLDFDGFLTEIIVEEDVVSVSLTVPEGSDYDSIILPDVFKECADSLIVFDERDTGVEFPNDEYILLPDLDLQAVAAALLIVEGLPLANLVVADRLEATPWTAKIAAVKAAVIAGLDDFAGTVHSVTTLNGTAFLVMLTLNDTSDETTVTASFTDTAQQNQIAVAAAMLVIADITDELDDLPVADRLEATPWTGKIAAVEAAIKALIPTFTGTVVATTDDGSSFNVTLTLGAASDDDDVTATFTDTAQQNQIAVGAAIAIIDGITDELDDLVVADRLAGTPWTAKIAAVETAIKALIPTFTGTVDVTTLNGTSFNVELTLGAATDDTNVTPTFTDANKQALDEAVILVWTLHNNVQTVSTAAANETSLLTWPLRVAAVDAIIRDLLTNGGFEVVAGTVGVTVAATNGLSFTVDLDFGNDAEQTLTLSFPDFVDQDGEDDANIALAIAAIDAADSDTDWFGSDRVVSVAIYENGSTPWALRIAYVKSVIEAILAAEDFNFIVGVAVDTTDGDDFEVTLTLGDNGEDSTTVAVTFIDIDTFTLTAAFDAFEDEVDNEGFFDEPLMLAKHEHIMDTSDPEAEAAMILAITARIVAFLAAEGFADVEVDVTIDDATNFEAVEITVELSLNDAVPQDKSSIIVSFTSDIWNIIEPVIEEILEMTLTNRGEVAAARASFIALPVSIYRSLIELHNGGATYKRLVDAENDFAIEDAMDAIGDPIDSDLADALMNLILTTVALANTGAQEAAIEDAIIAFLAGLDDILVTPNGTIEVVVTWNSGPSTFGVALTLDDATDTFTLALADVAFTTLAVLAVMDMIDELDDGDATFAADVAAARVAFNALNTAEKDVVENANDLFGAEIGIAMDKIDAAITANDFVDINGPGGAQAETTGPWTIRGGAIQAMIIAIIGNAAITVAAPTTVDGDAFAVELSIGTVDDTKTVNATWGADA